MSTGVAYPRCCCTRLRLFPPERMAWAAWRISVGDEDETDEQTGQPQCDLCSDCMSRVTALRGSARDAEVAILGCVERCVKSSWGSEARGCCSTRTLPAGLRNNSPDCPAEFRRPAARLIGFPGEPKAPQLRGDPRLSCASARTDEMRFFELLLRSLNKLDTV